MPEDKQAPQAPNQSRSAPQASDHAHLLEENRLLAQRYLELENSSRRQIAKLRSANALLSKGEADLRLLLDNAAVGFALLDPNMRVVSANQALCGILGVSPSDIPGDNFNNFVYIGKLPAFTRITGQAAGHAHPRDNIDLVARNGRLTPCRVMVSDWLDDDGAARGYFLLVFNLDEDLQAAARLREMETIIAETEKSRNLFLDVVSRELRTPANGIAGLIRMLMDEGLSDRQAELAGAIHSSAGSMVRLIDDIVDVVRVDAGDILVNPVPIDPADLAEGVIDLFAVRAEEKGLELRVHVSSAVPETVLADPTPLRRVLVHLLENAFKFTDRGHVSLTIDVIGDNLRFMVSDTGSGVEAPDDRDILGDYPPDDSPAARRRGGIGIGLAISKRLVGIMGGKIGYESEPGRGSEFHFSIPLIAHDGSAHDGSGDETGVESPAEAMRLPPLSILLAEANPLGRRLVNAYLQFDGHDLTLAGSGLEAAEKCRTGGFDLILLDQHLPKLDGVQTLRIIRDDETAGGRARTPALLMTPTGQLRDPEYYRKRGADGAVGKPVQPVDLMAAIAAATGVRPLAVARERLPGQYAAEARGGAIRRVDPSQFANLRQIMPEDQFLSLLRFFMEDAVPGIVGLAGAAARENPDPERLAFAAAKARGLSGHLGFSGLAEMLKRLEAAARAGAAIGELREIAAELPTVVDDTLEEAKRILPRAFATISAMSGTLPEEEER